MNREDECYFLSKRKFRENANIIVFLHQKKEELVALYMVEILEKFETIYKYPTN